jgi:hypothetical protein
VRTRIGANEALRLTDLPLKDHERLFGERVPLEPERHRRVRPSDPWDWGRMAENVEAWGFRVMQATKELVDRPTMAQEWFTREYVPVVDLLREAGLLQPDEPETEGYMRLACERWRLLQTWRWDDDVIDRLRASRERR